MILDSISNAQIYYPIHFGFSTVFEFLGSNDVTCLEDGKYELDGDDVFLITTTYQTKKFIQDGWESHRRYIDIQLILEGEEIIYYSPLDSLKETDSYSIEKDYLKLRGEGVPLVLKPGNFMILFPADGHQPGIQTGTDALPVKKMVFKVKV
ncbi:MAG: YhcH/YjgK/YiaL family protein [Ignavibacteriaceae bacterium]|nr:YhcH/YjgK/YiaL family protein [Ignavibacteriaceae bacterium]